LLLETNIGQEKPSPDDEKGTAAAAYEISPGTTRMYYPLQLVDYASKI